MIIETHGEVCRLGYLRLIAAIASSSETLSMDFMASVLEEAVRKVQNEPLSPSDIRPIGIINSRVSARNYVALAYGLDVIDKKTGSIGRSGVIYSSLRSSSKYDAFLKGVVTLSHRDLITLNQVERFLFLTIITVKDYLMIPRIVKWLASLEELTRLDGMNYIMEEVYPQALKTLAASANKGRREEIMAKLDEALKFREERTRFGSKAEWIKSSLYAKYRHVAPPRLEWLVDVGLLERSGRGKYVVSEMFRRNAELFVRATSQPPGSLVEQLFVNVAPLYIPYGTRAQKDVINAELVKSFHALLNITKRPIPLEVLELATSFRLLENNNLTTPKVVHESINNLTLVYPEKVYIAPGSDSSLQITRLDLELRET